MELIVYSLSDGQKYIVRKLNIQMWNISNPDSNERDFNTYI